MATPAVGGTTAGAPRTAAARPGQPPAPGRLGNDEYSSAPLPLPQEAAVLYAGNFTEACTKLLRAEIKDAKGAANKQAWLMLFDVYQIVSNRQEFDALSMLFSVKFEQSPPAWMDNADLPTDARQPPPRERKDLFALKGGKEMAAEIEKLRAF